MKNSSFLTGLFFVIVTLHFNLVQVKLTGQDLFRNKTIIGIQDTCIIEGHIFEIVDYKTPNPLKAIVKSGRIRILDLNGNEKNFRVIRYVFSIRSDERVASVRSYGDLVSYPVLQILKDARVGEPFYFEEIIIVDENREIQNNAVRPILIKRKGN